MSRSHIRIFLLVFKIKRNIFLGKYIGDFFLSNKYIGDGDTNLQGPVEPNKREWANPYHFPGPIQGTFQEFTCQTLAQHSQRLPPPPPSAGAWRRFQRWPSRAARTTRRKIIPRRPPWCASTLRSLSSARPSPPRPPATAPSSSPSATPLAGEPPGRSPRPASSPSAR